MNEKYRYRTPLIYGPPESGKTTAALLYASQKKGGYIYVNLKDLRLKNPDIATLFRFCNSKNISTLILDGYKNDTLPLDDKIQTILIDAATISISLA